MHPNITVDLPVQFAWVHTPDNMDLIEGLRRIKGFGGGAIHENIRLGASYMKGY